MYIVRYHCNTKTQVRLYLPLLFSLILLCCCSPKADQRSLLPEDMRPPVFIRTEVNDNRHVTLTFSEPVSLQPGRFTSIPELPLQTSESSGSSLILVFSDDMEAGLEYAFEMTVEDDAGNTHTLLTRIYGFNPRVPELQLNEITTQGSSSNPDKTELLILSEGNTAGVALFEGTIDYWDQMMIFPPVEVAAGDYIVVHFKPSGSPNEVDETESKLQCSAEEATEGWDFWLAGGSGLSGNNGVISVYTHNAGTLIDGFLYSNRTSASDQDYRGFGSSSTMNKADQLWEQEGWTAAGRLIAPEDAVNPDDSTATRSMDRMPGAEDTDCAADWFIVDTSQSSFGGENSSQLYVP